MMDTFERKEIKYLLTPAQCERFQQAVNEKVAPAEFCEGDISSVYYDTPDYLLANRSIDGGTYKEKLRVRSYGGSCSGDAVYIEIKKKFKGIVYKRRVCCTQRAADGFLAGMPYAEAIERWPLADTELQARCRDWKSLQIAGEIAWMRDRFEGIAARMRVDVHRFSLVGIEDEQLRLTFDYNARYSQLAGRHGQVILQPLFPNGEIILELKCAKALPLWLVQALDECGARPQSVSKYGRAYQAAMKPRMHRVA